MYSNPDPAWDYYSLWQETLKLQDSIEELGFYLCSLEVAGKNTNQKLSKKFQDIKQEAERAIALIDEQ